MKKVICLILSVITLIGIVPMGIYAEERPFHDVPADDIEAAAQREDGELGEDIAEAPSVVTEKGMQFRIDNLQDVKSIRYAYGEYETEKDIKYGVDSVSHSAKTLRTRGDSCVLQFTKPGLVSIVVTYNDGTRDFYKYDVIKSTPTVTRDGGNSITFGNLNDLKVLRYVKGEYDSSYDIKRASGSVAISGKALTSDTYTITLERETYTFCVQYNDESYNYYVTGVCGDNLTWVYDMQTATLTISGEGEMEEYGYKGTPWYDHNSEIENLILNEGITTISPNAFAKITKITEVTFPSTLKTIGPIAFSGCEQLVSIDIPGNVEYIGESAFIECISLEQLILRPGVKEISFFSFAYCQSLTSVSFPNTLKRIGGQAFYFCSSLENIQLPDTDIELYYDCFWNTAFAKNPDNWENHALYLGNYLISLEEVYEGSSFTVREGTKYIAGYSLYGDYLKMVIIPSSVEFMYDKAIPDKNIKIYCYKNSYAHKYAIENGHKYELLIANTVGGVCGDNLTWEYNFDTATLTISGEGEMYKYDYKEIPWYDYNSEIENLILNEGIVSITHDAFALFNIKEIKFPSTLKTIGTSAFYNCKSLETLVIPNSIERIAYGAFDSCQNLESVIIGNGVKEIEIFTFAQCTSLTNITFPETLEKICSQAFSGCSSLENIQLPDKAINIESDCFIGTAFFTNPDNWEDGTLYLDNFLITGPRYTQVPFTVKNGTKYIGSYSLIEVYELQTITIPPSVVFIGEYAISKDVIILCYENSYAHQYAKEHGYSFEFIY